MEEQLISFETAKLAKEKGFNWKVLYHYRDSDIINNGALYNFNNKEEQALWNIELISASTQSLLQRWLREEHNCIVEPYYLKDLLETKITFKATVDYYKNDWSGELNDEPDFYSNEYNTYEEALEEGLIAALKLI